MSESRLRRSLALLGCVPLVLATIAGCNSTKSAKDNARRGLSDDELASAKIDVGTLSDRPIDLQDNRDAGAILADFDGQIRRWNEFALSDHAEDQRKRRRLEEFLRVMSRKHMQLLEGELSSPNARHRSIACSALGFSGETEITGDLVAALDDKVVEVVDNALLGLGLLADPLTPIAPLLRQLEAANDPWTRSNAAYALKRILEGGGAAEEPARTDLRNGLKLALLDREDAVRVQAAAALQLAGERADMSALVDALYDPTAMVVLASAMAVRRIGEVDEAARGESARALFEAWLEREERPVRTHLKAELARLAGRNFGDDEKEWRDWAYRLP